jgi:hypothetical protein
MGGTGCLPQLRKSTCKGMLTRWTSRHRIWRRQNFPQQLSGDNSLKTTRTNGEFVAHTYILPCICDDSQLCYEHPHHIYIYIYTTRVKENSLENLVTYVENQIVFDDDTRMMTSKSVFQRRFRELIDIAVAAGNTRSFHWLCDQASLLPQSCERVDLKEVPNTLQPLQLEPQMHCPSTTAPLPLPLRHCLSATAPPLLPLRHCPSTSAHPPLHLCSCPSATAPLHLPLCRCPSATAPPPLPLHIRPSATAPLPLLPELGTRAAFN